MVNHYDDDFSESPFENMREYSAKRTKKKGSSIQKQDKESKKGDGLTMTKRLTILVIGLILVILIAFFALMTLNKDAMVQPLPSPTASPTPTILPTSSLTPTPTPTLDIRQYDTTSFGSVTQIVNKKHPLQSNDIPDDMVSIDMPTTISDMTIKREVNDALNQLYAAAKDEGIDLYVNTAYIGYYWQDDLFDQMVQQAGYDYALLIQPKAGYSEHQTGYAVDFISKQDGHYTRYNDSTRSNCDPKQCEQNDAALWLKEHASEYGFIQRYPLGKAEITGYDSQWWHYRYVGKELALYMDEHGLTMEECFDVEGGY